MSSKLATLIDILERRDGNEFESFTKCDLPLTSSRLLDELLQDPFSKRQLEKIAMLSWLIFVELSGRSFGEPSHFDVAGPYISLQKYTYSWGRLSRKNIPFEEWSDLAAEGINLLKKLLKENKLEYFETDSRYQNFKKRFTERHEELRLKKGYSKLNEFMDD
ncbi:MAG: hypothetical protein HQK53_12825 [Oligoflexia bacterium]|nr:hypothetical protein [Oligoflexia bacterium]